MNAKLNSVSLEMTHHLRDIIGLPENIILYNGVNVDSVKALCILLKRRIAMPGLFQMSRLGI